MTLYEMLDRTFYFGEVMIYDRNDYDQCMHIFTGRVQEARTDEYAWNYLMHDVDMWKCGNNVMLIFVDSDDTSRRAEDVYIGSDKWALDNHPWKLSWEVEMILKEYGEKRVKE